MKRSNLVKGIICGLMLTTVMGTAVLAGTNSAKIPEYFIGNGTTAKGEEGDTGMYIAVAAKEYFQVKAESTSFELRKFYIEANRKLWKTDCVQEMNASEKNMTRFMSFSTSVGRDRTDVMSSCEGRFIAYNSNHVHSGVLDDYTIVIHQRNK